MRVSCGIAVGRGEHDEYGVALAHRLAGVDGVVAGQSMREGDAILVVLAAANRDPAANPHPDRFDPDRAAPRSFTFGLGPHACVGEALAVAIARAGVARLLTAGVDVQGLDVTYRPSPNTRVPLSGAAPPARGTALS
jgi:cytochrome P450